MGPETPLRSDRELMRLRRILTLSVICVGAIAPVGCADYSHVTYRGSIPAPDGPPWGPEHPTDHSQYIMRLTISWPRDVGQIAGNAVYTTIGGIAVCRARLRLIDPGTTTSSPLFAEKRTRTSATGTKAKRRVIKRARSWCSSRPWRVTLSSNIGNVIQREDGGAPDSLSVRGQFGLQRGVLRRVGGS